MLSLLNNLGLLYIGIVEEAAPKCLREAGAVVKLLCSAILLISSMLILRYPIPSTPSPSKVTDCLLKRTFLAGDIFII
jgi:hypothetical protein